MRQLSIGKVAQAAGMSASALRYYEKAGLLPPPPRAARQRRYDESVFGRIELIRLALDAGFTIRETRTFLSGFAADTPPAARWRALAARKLPELEQAIERAQRMKCLLESSFRCRCLELADCERYLSAARRQRLRKASPRPCAE
jgi:MerR family redox-sensitive transcriptional activator SoxR